MTIPTIFDADVDGPTVDDFDAARYIDEHGVERWGARALMAPLGYSQWRRFEQAIDRARTACGGAGFEPADHFVATGKMIPLGKGAVREVTDYHLSRYAAYLVVMNGDTRKRPVAAAQTYFATQTRRMEVLDTAPEMMLASVGFDALMAEAVLRAQQHLAHAQQINAAQAAQIEAQAPIVERHLALTDATGTYDMGAAAQALRGLGAEIGRQRLYDQLRAWGLVVQSDTRPTQRAVEAGWLEVKVGVRTDRNGADVATYSVRVTPRGLDHIAKRLQNEGVAA